MPSTHKLHTYSALDIFALTMGHIFSVPVLKDITEDLKKSLYKGDYRYDPITGHLWGHNPDDWLGDIWNKYRDEFNHYNHARNSY